MRTAILVVLVVISACAASQPPPARNPGGTRRQLSRSSIAAILERGGELSLAEDQVSALERIQSELDKKNDQARKELGDRPSASGPANSPSSDGAGGRRRGPGPGAPGGAGHAPRRPDRDRATQGGGLQRALDDNDTAAFTAAESVLRPEQRERARAIAEQYREDLFDWREQQHR